MMKDIFAVTIAVAVSSLLFISFQAFGQDADVSTKIEDPAFKNYCLNVFDNNKDGMISLEEASQAKQISVPFEGIKTLKGIEYFVNITTLDCAFNQLTSLDVCKNTALWRLDCSYNQLTSLDVSGDVALKELICWGNKLTSLDVSKNVALTQLNCYSNKLTNLDVRNNPALTLLHCHENQLTGLDVSKNTALEELVCYKNQLASLDVSKNKALEYLDCSQNQLTNLDVSNNTKLKTLKREGNPIPSSTTNDAPNSLSAFGTTLLKMSESEISSVLAGSYYVHRPPKDGWYDPDDGTLGMSINSSGFNLVHEFAQTIYPATGSGNINGKVTESVSYYNGTWYKGTLGGVRSYVLVGYKQSIKLMNFSNGTWIGNSEEIIPTKSTSAIVIQYENGVWYYVNNTRQRFPFKKK